MGDFLHGLLGAGALLLFAAVLVAWWEHLGRQSQARAPLEPARPAGPVRVDVELEDLAEPPPSPLPQGDSASRREALGTALDRRVQGREAGPAQGRRGTWTDTVPMVGPGPAVEPASAQASET
jgi:hypothetical protein